MAPKDSVKRETNDLNLAGHFPEEFFDNEDRGQLCYQRFPSVNVERLKHPDLPAAAGSRNALLYV